MDVGWMHYYGLLSPMFRVVAAQRHNGLIANRFQKKSKSGIKTPQQEIDLIARRLKAAEEDYKTHYQREK